MESLYLCSLADVEPSRLSLFTEFKTPPIGMTQVNLWADVDKNGWPETHVSMLKRYTDPDGERSTTWTLGTRTLLLGNYIQIVWRVARVPIDMEKPSFTLAIVTDTGKRLDLSSSDGKEKQDLLEFEPAFAHADTAIQEFQTVVGFK